MTTSAEEKAMEEIAGHFEICPLSSMSQSALLVSLATSIGYLPEPQKSSAHRLFMTIILNHPDHCELAQHCADFVEATS